MRKKKSSDPEDLLKFKAEGREFPGPYRTTMQVLQMKNVRSCRKAKCIFKRCLSVNQILIELLTS